jgi:SET domain-containing protein
LFINHCCDPNCETEQDENGRIFVSTIRDIAAGEELTYEYNLHDSDEDSQDCYCGVPNCRTTMFSDLELRRRARRAKREAMGKNQSR